MNNLREEVARLLARYSDCDIAGVKMSTLRAIEAELNPPADGYEIPVARIDARPYQLMEAAAIDRMRAALKEEQS